MKLSECKSVADLQAMADAAEGDMSCFWYVEDGEIMSILQANVRFVANLATGRFDWYELACADDVGKLLHRAPQSLASSDGPRRGVCEDSIPFPHDAKGLADLSPARPASSRESEQEEGAKNEGFIFTLRQGTCGRGAEEDGLMDTYNDDLPCLLAINGRISFEPIGKDEAAILQKYGTISGTGLDDIVLGMKSAHGRISCSWEDYMRYKELHHAELRRIGL